MTAFDEGQVDRDDHGRFAPTEGGGSSEETKGEANLSPEHQELRDELANDAKGDKQVAKILKTEKDIAKADERASVLRREANELVDKHIARFDKDGTRTTKEEKAEVDGKFAQASKTEADAREKAREDIRASLKVPASKEAVVAVHKAAGVSEPLGKEADKAVEFLKGVVSQKAAGDLYFAPKVMELSGEKARANYTAAGGWCHMGKNDDAGTVVHEMGHHLEETPRVKEAANKFLDMRIAAAGTPTVPMKEAAPRHGYGKDEFGNKDSFDKLFAGDSAKAFYVGKRYPEDRSTEVISMGLEQLHRDPVRFAKRDPEYFKFITGVLDGRHLK